MPSLTTTAPQRERDRQAQTGLEAADDLRTSISLHRTDPGDCGYRQVFARVDGGPRIALVFGESVTLDVKPGSHELFVHNTLFRKRVKFVIEPAEHLSFMIINSARWWTAGVVGVVGAAPLFLTVRQLTTPPEI